MALTCWDVGVELRGFEPLTSCMPWPRHPLTPPAPTVLCTTGPQLRTDDTRGVAVLRAASRGMASGNFLASAVRPTSLLWPLPYEGSAAPTRTSTAPCDRTTSV
jgi:hypothetical protein